MRFAGVSTHSFVLVDPVLVHHKQFLHVCIHILDSPTDFLTNHTLITFYILLLFFSLSPFSHVWFLVMTPYLCLVFQLRRNQGFFQPQPRAGRCATLIYLLQVKNVSYW